MTAAERMLLLLCCDLGDGERPLTPAQQQTLRKRLLLTPPSAPEQRLDAAALRHLGYGEQEAGHILALLARTDVLQAYLDGARQQEIGVLTLHHPAYPRLLRDRLGMHAPPALFYRGDLRLLGGHCVSLVGSRRLQPTGTAFAERVGALAAHEGYTLVSGNAPGADRLAQQACLNGGGRVISVLADSIAGHPSRAGVLYLCEDGWQLPFSPLRALRRNRIIHALGRKILVAQTGCGIGGTWNGASEALRLGIGPMFVCDDGSEGAAALAARGATPVKPEELHELSTLLPLQQSFFDPVDKND